MREIVSRSTFSCRSCPDAAKTNNRVITREQAPRANLFIHAPRENQSGIIQPAFPRRRLANCKVISTAERVVTFLRALSFRAAFFSRESLLLACAGPIPSAPNPTFDRRFATFLYF